MMKAARGSLAHFFTSQCYRATGTTFREEHLRAVGRVAPYLSRLTSNGTSAYKDFLHAYALVLITTYPQITHTMWQLTFTRGQDIVVGKGRSKVRWRYRPKKSHGLC